MKENKDLTGGDKVDVTRCSYVDRDHVIKENGEPPYVVLEKVDQCTFLVKTPNKNEVMVPTCVIKFWENDK